MQLRGSGTVVLELPGELASVPCTPGRPLLVRREWIVGWLGRLVPRAAPPAESPSGQRGLDRLLRRRHRARLRELTLAMSAEVSAAKPPAPVPRGRRAQHPNLLTMARIVAIPFFVWLLDTPTPVRGFWACIVFTLAAITDVLDGYLARKLGVVSVLGKFLDPLADKLIVMAALVWMVPMGRIAGVGRRAPARARDQRDGPAQRRRERGGRHQRRPGGQDEDGAADDRDRRARARVPVPPRATRASTSAWSTSSTSGARSSYLSLLFSFASAAQYVRLFAAAVEAKEKRRDARLSRPRRAVEMARPRAGSDPFFAFCPSERRDEAMRQPRILDVVRAVKQHRARHPEVARGGMRHRNDSASPGRYRNPGVPVALVELAVEMAAERDPDCEPSHVSFREPSAARRSAIRSYRGDLEERQLFRLTSQRGTAAGALSG